MSAKKAQFALLLLLLFVAAVLRFSFLDAIPNPAGDEGNWMWFAHDAYLGRPHPLPPEARIVPPTFTHLLATAFRLAGSSFATARATLGVLQLSLIFLAFSALRSVQLPRAALTVFAVLAVHPYAVAWCRTVSTPYGIALGLHLAAPCVLLAALGKQGFSSSILLFLSGQLLFGELHFTPLTPVAVGACVLWSLLRPQGRALYRRPAFYVALVGGLFHAAIVLPGIMGVYDSRWGRPRHYFTAMLQRIETYVRMFLDGLTGEATLRHFVGHPLPRFFEMFLQLGAASMFALVALSLRREEETTKTTFVPLTELRWLALCYALTAFVLAPILLAPSRTWNLPNIDAERYLFIAVVPFALALGALQEDRNHRFRNAALVATLWLLVPLARLSYGALFLGSKDYGSYLLPGGRAYRGWRTPHERRALPHLLLESIEQEAHGVRCEVLVPDYAFHPMHYAFHRRPYFITDTSKFPIPEHPGRRYFFVLWAPTLFAPGYVPESEPAANQALRTRMQQHYREVHLVRLFTQPDGSPLAELWTGIQPLTPTP